MTNVLSENQLAQLSELGYLKLPAAIPAHDALAMRARMWEALAVGGADPADRSTWRTVDRKALKRAVQRDAFAAYASSTVRAVADQLLGAGGWGPPAHWGLTMVTFPEDGEWSVPHRGWHLDSSPRTGPADQLIRTFAAARHPGGGWGGHPYRLRQPSVGGQDGTDAHAQHPAHGVSRGQTDPGLCRRLVRWPVSPRRGARPLEVAHDRPACRGRSRGWGRRVHR